MRRATALVVTVLLVAGVCGGDDDEDAAPSTTSTSTTTSTTVESAGTTSTTEVAVPETLELSGACAGIGALDGAEVSWVRDGRVWTASADGTRERCVAEYSGPARLQWGGDGDRLLVGERSVLVASGPLSLVPDHLDAVGWSRPTGKALLARSAEGAVSKLSLVGESPLELGLPFTEGEVLYHPSGTAIALVSMTAASTAPPDLLLANNRGEDVRWIVTNESADAIRDLAFTASGAVVFAAEHGGRTHVHRLVLGSDTLENLLDEGGPVGHLAASPYDEDLIAVGRVACRGAASGPLWLHDGSTTGDVAATDAANGEPVGWLPDGSLVVLVHDDGCDDEPGDLYVVADGAATLIAEHVEAAAVRAQLPPPPPPPPEIEAAPA